MSVRNYIVGIVAVALLIWGPLDHTWPAVFLIRTGYIVGLSLAVWALLAWVWRIWQPDPRLDELCGEFLCGLICLSVAFCVWFSVGGNPFDDLAFIRHSRTADGYIIDSWEDVGSADRGGTFWCYSLTYTYRVSGGVEFTNRTRQGYGRGRLKKELRDIAEPVATQVEYLPDRPHVSRIKGSGSPTLFNWLWRIAGLGSLYLAILMSPGYILLTHASPGLRAYHRHRLTKPESQRRVFPTMTTDDAREILRRYYDALSHRSRECGDIANCRSHLHDSQERIVQAIKLLLARDIEQNVLSKEREDDLCAAAFHLAFYVNDDHANTLNGMVRASMATPESEVPHSQSSATLTTPHSARNWYNFATSEGARLQTDLRAFVASVRQLDRGDPGYHQRICTMTGLECTPPWKGWFRTCFKVNRSGEYREHT